MTNWYDKFRDLAEVSENCKKLISLGIPAARSKTETRI